MSYMFCRLLIEKKKHVYVKAVSHYIFNSSGHAHLPMQCNKPVKISIDCFCELQSYCRRKSSQNFFVTLYSAIFGLGLITVGNYATGGSGQSMQEVQVRNGHGKLGAYEPMRGLGALPLVESRDKAPDQGFKR